MTYAASTLYFRDEMRAEFITDGAEPAYVTTTDYAASSMDGNNAKLLFFQNGAASTTVTVAGSVGTGNTPKTYMLGQFVSPALEAQSISSGTWTVGYGVNGGNVNHTYQRYARVDLRNGATGAVRTNIFSGQIGGNSSAGNDYRTAYGTISGSSATATAGDYISIEVWISVTSTAANASRTISFRYGNSTAITAQNTLLTTPASFVAAPSNLNYYSADLFLTDDDNGGTALDASSNLELFLQSERGSGAVEYAVTAPSDDFLGKIQLTNTAGGTPIVWYSQPLDPGNVRGPIEFTLWGRESGAGVNIVRMVDLQIVNGDGTAVSNIQLNATTDLEFTTTSATGTNLIIYPSSVQSIPSGGRLKLTLYIAERSGLVSGGGTGYYKVNEDTPSTDGDSYVRFYFPLTEFTVVNGTFSGAVSTATAELLAMTPVYGQVHTAALLAATTTSLDSSVSGGTGATISAALSTATTTLLDAAVRLNSYFLAQEQIAVAFFETMGIQVNSTIPLAVLTATTEMLTSLIGIRYTALVDALTATSTSYDSIFVIGKTIVAEVLAASAASPEATVAFDYTWFAAVLEASAVSSEAYITNATFVYAAVLDALAESYAADFEVIISNITALLSLAATITGVDKLLTMITQPSIPGTFTGIQAIAPYTEAMFTARTQLVVPITAQTVLVVEE